ncbi:hypothetical protein V5F89_06180 [Pelagerythrobacter marensis]|uniref:Flagellar hook-length control protein-like C-terminal domain-containing protein n=1 Tax=Pelagerythrobacter marensis TaxID=543877 RepID=A0ABZ2DAS1_9SPHN
MISQLLSNTPMSATPTKGEPRPAPGEDNAEAGGFSGLLATLGSAVRGAASGENAGEDMLAVSGAADEGEAAEQAPDPLALALAVDAELPAIAGTGKVLPVSAAELPAGTVPPAEGGSAAAAMPTLLGRGAGTVASEIPAGRTTGAPALSAENAPSPGAAAIQQAARPAVAIEVAPRPSNLAGEIGGTGPLHQAAGTALDVSAGREAGQREGGGHMRNQSDAQPAPRATAEQAAAANPKPSAEQATFAATAAAATAASGGASGGAQGGLAPNAAAIPAPGAPSVETANPFTANRPAIETQVARELGRIVDSLASAREAFTARAATLALDHAEFGELSLRFDQRRDGQLAVQLSATDPEAHRAIAAAVAERPTVANGDAGAASGQNGAQAGGNASARAGAERGDGGFAEDRAAGRDRREPGRDADRHSGGRGQPGGQAASGNGRAAIYA